MTRFARSFVIEHDLGPVDALSARIESGDCPNPVECPQGRKGREEDSRVCLQIQILAKMLNLLRKYLTHEVGFSSYGTRSASATRVSI
jgi:hypothetical protein